MTDKGPRLVWTFPVIRRFKDARLLNNLGTGMNIVSNRLNLDDSKESNGSSDQRTINVTESESTTFDTNNEEQVESDLDTLSSGESVFQQEEDGESDINAERTDHVEIEEGTFLPVVTRISVGDEVTWTNEDNDAHKVMAVEGAEFASGVLSPEETFSHTFSSEGVVVYGDPLVGVDEMCGAIVVGDAELEQQEQLPCIKNIERQLFAEGSEENEEDENESEVTTSSADIKSMSEAAEEKQEQDRGF